MIFQFSIQPKEISTSSKQLYFNAEKTDPLNGFPFLCIGRDSYVVSAKNENGLNINPGFVYNLQIGKFCSLAHDISFVIDINHDYTGVTTGVSELFPERKSKLKRKGQILIQNDVWIGRGSTIMGGVTIHNGAVIAANSVVTKDVEPYSIVGGNPARHIKYRFDSEIIDKMLSIQWWYWDDSKISQYKKWFTSDITDFAERFYGDTEENREMEIEKSEKSYLFFMDFEEPQSLWKKIILEFCEKYKNSPDRGLLLFLKNNDNTLDNYSKIEDITKDIDAECGLFVHCGTDEDVEYIFKYADYYITNRSKETVYHSCMADKYNVQMLSGVDIPVF